MKWNFSTPRGEYIEQLKEQMRSCVSSTMLANLFHADFKFHLKAITTLTEVTGGLLSYYNFVTFVLLFAKKFELQIN